MEKRTPAMSGSLIGGTLVSILVVLVTAVLAAEAERSEALQRERRSAYADLIASAHTCESFAIAEGGLDFPSEVFDANKKQLTKMSDEDLRRFGANYRRDSRTAFTQFRDCSLSIRTSSAMVTLLSEDRRVRNAAFELTIDTVDFAAGRDGALKKYINSLSTFEALARESANRRVLSPYLVVVGGIVVTSIVFVISLVLAARLPTLKEAAPAPPSADVRGEDQAG